MSIVSDIFDQFHVPYVERGANVKRGNINIRCPFCLDDPSHHMGVWPDKGTYSCWRDKAHRGGNFAKLLSAAAGISYERARDACASHFDVWARDDAFNSAIRSLQDEPTVEKRAPREKSIERWLRGIEVLSVDNVLARRHCRYLRSRGFDPRVAARRYSLMYAPSGEWRDRIIVPYFFRGKLVTWSARSIHQSHVVRYKALADDKSLRTTKQTLYNFDRAMGREGTLYVVEGPFDAMKLDYFLPRDAGAVVGLSSVAIEDEQLVLLIGLAKRFRRLVLMMDPEEIAKPMRMQSELGDKAEVFDWSVADGFEDPGKFDSKIVHKIAKRYSC